MAASITFKQLYLLYLITRPVMHKIYTEFNVTQCCKGTQ